jgi:uncharacterized repeat protein (TIGR02543 family)
MHNYFIKLGGFMQNRSIFKLIISFLVLFLITNCGGGGGNNSTPPPNNNTYTVTYLSNGSTSGSAPIDFSSYIQGQTVTVIGNTGNLLRTHYSFNGWNTATDGNGTTYTQGQTFIMGPSNVTLYAKWTSNPTYKVTYEANGADSGDIPVDNTNYEEGQLVTVLGNNSLVKSGYGLVWWNTAADGTGTTYLKGKTFSIGAANVTLYAIWKYDHYVAGSYNNGTYNVACYWKNGEKTDLYNTNNSSASSVFVSGTDTYVTGSYYNGTYYVACYWNNGVKTDLIIQNNLNVIDMFVSGTDVYSSGYYVSGRNIACYWKNSTKYDLINTTGDSYGGSIFVSGTNVYVNGDYQSGVTIPCYWKDGTIYYLPVVKVANAYTNSIFVSGTDVYVIGRHYNASSQLKACYWKNTDNPVDLTITGSYNMFSVFVSGTDVYISGYNNNGSYDEACYWKNGTKTPLNSDGNKAYAFSIFVSDTDIYAAGYYTLGVTNIACYWLNGTRIDLHDGSSSASSIKVITP